MEATLKAETFSMPLSGAVHAAQQFARRSSSSAILVA
jgi:hypothetical protein